MENERLKKLGIEKTKTLNEDFDKVYEFYKQRALEAGCLGELKFKKQHGRVFIYVVL